MKKHSFKIITKKLIGALLVSAVISLGAAAAATPVDTAFTTNTANVKFLGTDKEGYVFNVAYNNETGDRFLLRIMDATGNALFTGSYNDRKFDKRFWLYKEGNDKLSFVIKNLKDNSVQTFQIITTTQVVEDVVVTKVK